MADIPLLFLIDILFFYFPDNPYFSNIDMWILINRILVTVSD